MLTRSGLLNNSITVRQNIWVGALLLGMTPDQVRERFNWIVTFGGLEKILDTYAKQVSPLMRRRVVWTVTMATQARSFAIQRSLVVGDQDFQDRCWEHLDGLKADGVTFLVETTDEMLLRFCERGVVVGNGGVIADTTVEEALKLRRVDETEEAEIQQEEAEDEDWQAE
jgi:ABC-type polysaccharide/polyol phosphate transport system ATPase subunit